MILWKNEFASAKSNVASKWAGKHIHFAGDSTFSNSMHSPTVYILQQSAFSYSVHTFTVCVL